jgi:peptidoglycan/LPS O-acetylase OafA/YrhL
LRLSATVVHSEGESRSFLPSLTGLRFVAALFVFGRHTLWVFGNTPLHEVANRLLFQGGLGVSFFILSGFVLT